MFNHAIFLNLATYECCNIPFQLFLSNMFAMFLCRQANAMLTVYKTFPQGFIDPSCGLITLLQLITTSNWHSVMNSVHKASGWWAYIYFILFYIAIDLILLDLMIAIAIEMYNAVSRQSDEAFGEQPGICFEVSI